jgi:molybdenum cofactor cytidylyltransferase
VKFGKILISEAEGALLAHSLRIDGGVLKKGRPLTADDIARLGETGMEHVVAARLETGDIGEDEAARQIAEAAASDASLRLGTAGTGRVNIFAAKQGLLDYDLASLDAVNRIDEAVTIATLPVHGEVAPGQMVATIKIIPYAVAGDVLARCLVAGRDLLRIAAYAPKRVALVQTTLPGFRKPLLEKGRTVTAARLAALGSPLEAAPRCEHTEDEISRNLLRLRDDGFDIALVLGASAITDRRDVIPAAIEAAGGRIEQLGMPVDPGNLTLLARLGRMWVLGLPGSARSPRLHGSDWILQRLVADIPVTAANIRAMGAGGLLKEIPGRPMPRAEASPIAVSKPGRPRIEALILAAGQSRRMGRRNKLLAEIDGRPMIARTVDSVLESRVSAATVVLGHEAAEVRAALADFDVALVENPDYADGLSTSLRRGLAALSDGTEAALVCLGDMPRISGAALNQLIEAFDPAAGRGICVPTHDGKRGNPVLLARRYFSEIQEISGDVGARQLLGAYAGDVHEVEMADDAVLIDIDTPDALERFIGGAARKDGR